MQLISKEKSLLYRPTHTTPGDDPGDIDFDLLGGGDTESAAPVTAVEKCRVITIVTYVTSTGLVYRYVCWYVFILGCNKLKKAKKEKILICCNFREGMDIGYAGYAVSFGPFAKSWPGRPSVGCHLLGSK